MDRFRASLRSVVVVMAVWAASAGSAAGQGTGAPSPGTQPASPSEPGSPPTMRFFAWSPKIEGHAFFPWVTTTHVNNLDVVSDVLRTTSFLNGSQVGSSTSDLTAATSTNLDFKWSRAAYGFGGVLGGPIVKDRLWVWGSAAADYGTTTGTSVDSAGTEITRKGKGWELRFGGGVGVGLNSPPASDGEWHYQIKGGLKWEDGSVDRAERNTASTVPGGTITEDFTDLESSNTKIHAAISASNSFVMFYGGTEYAKRDFTFTRHVAIDFSQTQSGASQRLEDVIDLKKDGFYLITGASVRAGKRLSIALDATLGSDVWEVGLGGLVRFK